MKRNKEKCPHLKLNLILALPEKDYLYNLTAKIYFTIVMSAYTCILILQEYLMLFKKSVYTFILIPQEYLLSNVI